MEANGSRWNTLETTVSYKARARLTPTLTHVVMYELVTSGAEERAMSDAGLFYDLIYIWNHHTHTTTNHINQPEENNNNNCNFHPFFTSLRGICPLINWKVSTTSSIVLLLFLFTV